MLIRAQRFDRLKSTRFKEGGIGSMPKDSLQSYMVHFDKFIRRKKGTKLYKKEMELFTQVARRDLGDSRYLDLLRHCDYDIYIAVADSLEREDV